MERLRKYQPLLIVAFVAISAVVIANFGFRVWQGITGRAVIKKTSGYSSLISAALYGLSYEEASALKAELVAGGYGEDSEVQNLQPPSISGFTTDIFTGNSTVTYSLDLPPGRGGLTPSLSLIYSSANVYDPVIGADFNEDGDHDSKDVNEWKKNLYVQSSQVGLGWNVGGLGYIYRDASGRYTLVLNGQSYRLFKKDDEYWRTEPEGFLRIHHKVIAYEEPGGEHPPGGECMENDNPSTSCVKKFNITDTDGTRYEFTPRGFFWKRCDDRTGSGRCIQQTEQWCREHYSGEWWKKCEQWAASYNKWVLNRVIDVYGNEIDIPYAEERRDLECGKHRDDGLLMYPRAIYPYEINYSGTYDPAGIDAGFKAKVEFYPLYPEQINKNRQDAQKIKNRERCHHVFYSKKRIERINVKVKQKDGSWKIVRQYVLDNDHYFTRPGDENKKLHLRLEGITARGRDDDADGWGDQALPAYNFVYNDDSNDLHHFRLLTTADNGYGGKVEYKYEQYLTPDFRPEDGTPRGHVSETHRVKQRRVFDGQGNFYKTTYAYEGPRGISDDPDHSGFESMGHKKVIETVFAKNSEDGVVKTTRYQFAQGEESGGRFFPVVERGRTKRVEVKGATGTLLSFNENDYLREPQDHNWETSHFVATKETRSCQDPTSGWPQGAKTTFHYEPRDQGGQQWGNLTHRTEYLVSDCNFGQALAYRMTNNVYFPNEEKWITNRVAGSQTFACNSNVDGTADILVDCPKPERIALSWNIYDGDYTKAAWSPPEKGLLTIARAFYEFPERVDPIGQSEFKNGSWRVVDTKNEYDNFGSLTAISSFTDYGRVSTSDSQWTFSPPGGGSRARRSETRYEKVYNTFPVETVNPLGHLTRTRHLYLKKTAQVLPSAGQSEQSEEEVKHPYLANAITRQDQNDINNNLRRLNLMDGLGRWLEIYLPGDNQPSEKTVYHDQVPFIIHRQRRDDKDDGSGPTYHHSWQIYNGLGQLIQSQIEEAGDGQKIALTAKSYNALGQTETETFPYNPNVAGGSYINPDWNQPHRRFIYDALGRITESREPPGESGERIARTGYFGRKTAVLDANRHLKVTETDGLGRLVRIEEFMGERNLEVPGDPYTATQFDYDHFDRLINTTDTLGNTSTISYNQYGQKESVDDPDLGFWHYTYYPTGTLETTTDAKGQVRRFEYDDLARTVRKYHKLICWMMPCEVEVASFLYDNCPNGIGRRCGDSTVNRPEEGFLGASTQYAYDVKGRLETQTRMIEGQTFVTEFAYDAAGRIRDIIYPGDGEKVTYSYNDAGRLVNVSGDQTYLASAEYNILGLPKEEVLGSQAKNIYTYEPRTYRLQTKTVENRSGVKLWKQELKYDPVGNINPIIYPLEGLTLNYSYDDLNRLTGMTSSRENYFANYDYDVLGRMTFKQEEGVIEECMPESLLAGDLDCDCDVDIIDIMKVATIWNSREGETEFNPNYDFDSDGDIDIVDIVYVASKWDTKCP